ncbi:MAG: cellulase family glycosylhydrolase [Anaerolineales bacterium]
MALWAAIGMLMLLVQACGSTGSTTPSPLDAGDGIATSPPDSRATSPPLAVSGDKLSLWTNGTQLRGANVHQRLVRLQLDGPEFAGPGPVGPPLTQDDFDRLAALGANYVNISHPGLFSEDPPYKLDQAVERNLDSLLEMIAAADMFAVISLRTGPGRSEFTFMLDEVGTWFDHSYLNDAVWSDREAQDAWVSMWRYIAERYRDNPIVVGYDLMVEPNANEVGPEEWDPEVFYQEYAGTTYDWNQLHPRIAAAIREVDSQTPILVGGMSYSAVEWLPYLEVTQDPRTVYTAHQYAPHQYTHQEWGRRMLTYPGEFDTDWDGVPDAFGRSMLEDLLSTLDDFTSDHGVPLAVNEFGVVRWVPGAVEYLDDLISLLEDRGINHALWAWEVSWEPYAEEVDAFNFRFGTDPDNREDVIPNELLDIITSYWSRNQVRPSTFGDTAPYPAVNLPGRSRLAAVKDWLYLIDVNLDQDMVEQIAASEHDMVVLDFIPSEVENTDYPMAEVVGRLHTCDHPKLVLAYIDIGEAESYRTYWQSGWRVGDPVWIVGEDPDGWQENYPVAYWYDAWRNIWLGEGGILQQILEAGFDGVYLDWVEAYSDERVMALADQDGVDPMAEMIRWVGDIGDFTRARTSDFIVIGQNAAELALQEEYAAVIDALAQEQVWFDGGPDNDPPGDCPLPRTEAEVDTSTYRASLSPACRRYYDQVPEGTLHVSSEWYLEVLLPLRDQGMVIFTVDYALQPDNVAWVYAESRLLGFVPLVTNRALDRFVDVFPEP